MSLETIGVGALTINFLVEGDDLAVFEVDVPAGARVPAPHSHDEFDEVIFALAGATTWTVGGEIRELAEGDALRIPRGVVHHFANHGERDARFLATVTPGAIGRDYFREVGAAAADGPAAVEAVMLRHGLTPVVAAAVA